MRPSAAVRCAVRDARVGSMFQGCAGSIYRSQPTGPVKHHPETSSPAALSHANQGTPGTLPPSANRTGGANTQERAAGQLPRAGSVGRGPSGRTSVLAGQTAKWADGVFDGLELHPSAYRNTHTLPRPRGLTWNHRVCTCPHTREKYWSVWSVHPYSLTCHVRVIEAPTSPLCQSVTFREVTDLTTDQRRSTPPSKTPP